MHAYSCPFPEGCTCGFSEAQAREAQLRRACVSVGKLAGAYEAERRKITVLSFQDQLEAMQPEIAFWNTLDHGKSPFRMEGHQHRGEGGATTACYQDAKLVGLSTLIRDPFNRTILVCVDLRN